MVQMREEKNTCIRSREIIKAVERYSLTGHVFPAKMTP